MVPVPAGHGRSPYVEGKNGILKEVAPAEITVLTKHLPVREARLSSDLLGGQTVPEEKVGRRRVGQGAGRKHANLL